MPLELVGARESLAAEQPVAHERPLAGVPTKMRLQMARLAVHLAASRDVATVNVLLAQVHAGGAEALCLLAVRAITGGAAGIAAIRSRWRRRCGRCGRRR